MSFSLSWSGSLVVVTITGGSEGSPNLASDLADQMMADSNANINSRAYRSGNLIWFDSIELRGQTSSWFKWDDDTRIELRTDFRCLPSQESSTNANDGAATIFGYRTVIAMSVSVWRNDSNVYLATNGGTAVFLRDNLGVNPLITKSNSARNDYPTLTRTVFPARITLEGLSYKLLSGSSSSQKWYFGNSRNIGSLDEVNNLLLSGGGEIFQTFNTTYNNAFIPAFTVAGEVDSNLVIINDSSFGMDGGASGGFNGTFRKGRYFINNPLFPINAWNGTITSGFSSGYTACFVVRFSNKITITDGANPISGVNVMVRGSVRSAGAGYDLSLLTDFPQADDISATTTGTGEVENFLIDSLRARNTAGIGNTDGAVESYQYTAQARKYELIAGRYIYQNRNYGVGGLLSSKDDTFVMLTDSTLDGVSEATAVAYTELDTSIKFYARAKYEWVANDNFQNDLYVTRSGNQINAGSYNVTIDATAASAFNVTGNLITIKASTYTGDMVTTGIITLANGAVFDGIRTDANGTVEPPQPITITNISAGSRMRIYNVTTGVETVNTVVSGTSYTSSYQEGTGYNDGDTVRVYLTKLGKEEWVGDVIDTSNGFNVLASQVDDDVYTALGVDGTTVIKFQADYPNNEVDLIIGADWTMAELYAWWANNLTTEDGIRNFFGGITAIDQANFRINTSIVDLYLDNTTNASYKQSDNRRFFRDTGTGYPVRNPTTSGYGLDVVWRNTILIAQTEAGGTSELNFYDVKRAVKQVITNPKYIKGQK